MRKMIDIAGLVLVSILATVIFFAFVVNSFAQAEIKTGDFKTYIVKKGDTPDDIISMLGKNIGVLRNVEIGQKIKYESQKFLQDGQKWGESLVYTIKRGDAPEKVAKKLEIPGSKLLEWNPGMGVRFIYVGQGIIYKKVETVSVVSEPSAQPEQIGLIKLKIIAEGIGNISRKQNDLFSRFGTQVDLLDFVTMRLGELTELRKKEILLIWLNFSVTILIGLLLMWFFWTYKNENKEKKGTKIEKESEKELLNIEDEEEKEEEDVWIRIEDKDYWYKVSKEGKRYVSLHINPKTQKPFLFRKKEDLIKSLKKTFSIRLDLFRKEIREGRLTEIDSKDRIKKGRMK